MHTFVKKYQQITARESKLARKRTVDCTRQCSATWCLRLEKKRGQIYFIGAIPAARFIGRILDLRSVRWMLDLGCGPGIYRFRVRSTFLSFYSLPREVMWYTAPGYSMLKGRAMGEYNTLKLLWQENRPDPIRTMLQRPYLIGGASGRRCGLNESWRG